MKKLLLIGTAVLLMATGTAHARSEAYYQCGIHLIRVTFGEGVPDLEYAYVIGEGRTGPEYARVIGKKPYQPLSSSFFHWRGFGAILYFQEKECEFLTAELDVDHKIERELKREWGTK